MAIRKSFRLSGTGNQYILHSTGFKSVRTPIQKEGSFRLQPTLRTSFQAVLVSVRPAGNDLDLYDLTLSHARTIPVIRLSGRNRIKRTVLPFLGSLIDFVGNDEMADVESSISLQSRISSSVLEAALIPLAYRR